MIFVRSSVQGIWCSCEVKSEPIWMETSLHPMIPLSKPSKR